MKPATIAYCWASGLIEFGETLPEGALPIITINSQAERETVEVLARLSYDNQLLVPGIPEAENMDEYREALVKFCHRVRERVLHPNKPRSR
ncbi:host nuclease inhibitor protein [Salmonella enterica]|nr:host nuclease inhibitor protein [Salmonella enterica]